MNIEEFREFSIGVKGATESLPFIDPNIIAFKVMDKMFAMASLKPRDGAFWVDIKCDPDYLEEIRDRYEGIVPPHIKTASSWCRLILESDLPDELIKELTANSVKITIQNLPKYKREEYANLPDL